MNVTLHQGSILDSDADFIVNPANNHLRHDGGLARVIDEAAAANRYRYPNHPEMWTNRDRAWLNQCADHPLIPTGGAGLTTAGCLPFKGVIHAVGPVWGGGRFYEPSLLMSAHTEALRIAAEQGAERVAFPAISCGIFGYPVDQASFTAILATKGSTIPVEFWLFSDEHVEAFTRSLSRVIAVAECWERAS